MENLLKNRKKIVLLILLFLFCVCSYQFPNLIYLSYHLGLFQDKVEDALGVSVVFRDKWSPSITFFIEQCLLSNTNKNITFIKPSLFQPWDSTDFIMFERRDFSDIDINHKKYANREKLINSWGTVYLIGTHGGDGFTAFVSYEYGLDIATSNVELLNEISSLTNTKIRGH